jgi:hypothetical protein
MARATAPLTEVQLRALPPVIDIPTAALALMLSERTAYDLARRDAFPCRVLRAGHAWRVITRGPDGLLAVLGLEPPPATDIRGDRPQTLKSAV